MSTPQAEPPGLVFCCSKNMTGEYALLSISALFQTLPPAPQPSGIKQSQSLFHEQACCQAPQEIYFRINALSTPRKPQASNPKHP